MKKLTAEKCRSVIEGFKWMAAEGPGMSIRDEYDIQAYELALPILEQQERGEGEWIEWRGGNCPTFSKAIVIVKLRCGQTIGPTNAKLFNWHQGIATKKEMRSDIIAYRIIPEQATNQNGEQ